MNKITIKACLKNTIVNLGKKICSFSQLQSEIKKRFLSEDDNNCSQLRIKLFYQGQQIRSLEELVEKAQKDKKQSVKVQIVSCGPQKPNKSDTDHPISLENPNLKNEKVLNMKEDSQQLLLKENDQKNMSFQYESKNQISQIKQKTNAKYHYKDEEQSEEEVQVCKSLIEVSENSKKYCFNEQKELINQNQNSYFDQVEQYQCYECCEQNVFSNKNLCRICKGTGYLHKNSKVVQFIQKVIQKRLQKIIQKFNKKCSETNSQSKQAKTKLHKEQNEKLVQKMEQKKELKQLSPDQIKIKVKYEEQKIIKKQGQQIKWQFQVTNDGQQEIPKNVYIRDMRTYKIVQIEGLKVNQTKRIQVGPFQNFQAGVSNVQLFQIFYKVSNQIRYPIGQKFGFVCQILKQCEKKVIDFSMFATVSKLKEFCQCQKSVQNIIMRLKQLGVDQNNIKNYSQEDLIDIIESFK